MCTVGGAMAVGACTCFDVDVSTILGNSLETALERESRPFQNSTNALFNRES